MFTGIVTGIFKVQSIVAKKGFSSFSIELDDAHLENLKVGASVAIDGVCMTVTRIENASVYFDASMETLRLTTLGQLRTGDWVNIERSAKAGVEIGGHPISGHVDGTAEVIEVEKPENNWIMTVKFPENSAKYLFNKGFVALNGCSLTISNLDKGASRFKVYLIPETLRLTTFEHLHPGDRINFEIDRQTQVIVDTLESSLNSLLGDRSFNRT